MKKYKVKVTETLNRIVEQEANSYEEALDLVEERYQNEEIVLDWHDNCNVEFKNYPYFNIKDDLVLAIIFNKESNKVHIGTDSSAGTRFDCKNVEDLKFAINSYIDDYIDLEDEKIVDNKKEDMDL